MAAPVLTAVSPGEGTAGTNITLTGSGFGATQATLTGYVSLFDAAIDALTGTTWGTSGGTALTIDSWSDTQIVFTLPSGLFAGTTAGVYVGNSNGTTATFPIAIPPASTVAVSTPGVYVEVLQQAPLPGAGIEVDIYDGGSLGTMLCTLENAYDVQFQDQFLAVGSGSFMLSRWDPKATAANLAIGNLVKIKVDGVYRFAFFIEEPNFVWLDPAGAQNEVITVSGRQAISILDRAIVYPFNWPTDKTATTNTFTLVTAANMMIYFIQEAQSRGGMQAVTWDFTVHVDSLNRNWLDSQTMNIPTGMSLLALVAQFNAMGIIFTMDANLVLHGYAVFGRDLTSTVILRAGRHLGTAQTSYQTPSPASPSTSVGNITAAEQALMARAAALEGVAIPNSQVAAMAHTTAFKNVLLAIAPNGTIIEVAGPASSNPGIGRREGVFNYQLSSDPTQVQNAAQSVMSALLNGSSPLQLPVLKGYDKGDYLPYVDYNLGDTIMVDIPGAEGLGMVSLQVVSITIAQDTTPSRDFQPTLDLGASPLDPLTAIANSLSALGAGTVTILGGGGGGGGVLSGGGSAPPPGSTGVVAVASGDTPGYLDQKIAVGSGLAVGSQAGPAGLEVLISRAPLAIPATPGAAGTVPTSTGPTTAPVWQAPSGGGGGGGGTDAPDGKPWNTTPPSSPSALNDEFNDSSGMSGPTNGLASKWTKYNLGTASWLVLSDAAAPGSLLLNVASGQAVPQAIYQPVPSSDFSAVARVTYQTPTGDREMWGVFIVDSSGAGMAMSLDYGNGMRLMEVSAWQQTGTGVFWGPAYSQDLPILLWLREASGVYYGGYTYGDRVVPNPAYEQTYTPAAFTPAYVGFGRMYGSGVGLVALDFFRVL